MDMEGIESLGRFLQEHNPFCIKSAKGKMLDFKSYTEIYQYTLEEIRRYCKRGYIDFVVLLQHLTQNPENMCMDLNMKAMKISPLMREDFIIVDWENIDGYYKVLETIIKSLHVITDSDFDTYHFQMAWAPFKTFNQKMNNEEKRNNN